MVLSIEERVFISVQLLSEHTVVVLEGIVQITAAIRFYPPHLQTSPAHPPINPKPLSGAIATSLIIILWVTSISEGQDFIFNFSSGMAVKPEL
jgi:hypothetical protein